MLPLSEAMNPQEELDQPAAPRGLQPGAKRPRKKSFRMPIDASATTCKNRSGAPRPGSAPPTASAASARLILMGSYLEHVTGDDPGKRDSLMKGLHVFLERGRDRELFDLPNKENPNGKPS